MSSFKSIGAMSALAALCAASVPPLQAETLLPLETVATFSDSRPGNIAVTSDNRIFISQQPLDGPALRVVEVLPDGSKVPFPTRDWADGPETGELGIAAIIGIAADSKDVIWLLDMGSAETPAQIVAWDTRANRLHRRIEIPADVVTPISFLQDFALDEKRGKIYIADMTFPAPGAAARPAFVVIDIASGSARRLLEGAEALMPVDHDIVIEGSLVGTKSAEGVSSALHLGVNPIAIDPAFEWVYFGSVNGSDVFRLPASALAEDAVTDEALAAQIERYAEKRPSDGIAVDGQGRVFISDIEASAVGVTTPEGYKVIAQDKLRLSWPDGFAFGPDGALYVTQNQLHAHPALNEGEDGTRKPYHILKLKP